MRAIHFSLIAFLLFVGCTEETVKEVVCQKNCETPTPPNAQSTPPPEVPGGTDEFDQDWPEITLKSKVIGSQFDGFVAVEYVPEKKQVRISVPLPIIPDLVETDLNFESLGTVEIRRNTDGSFFATGHFDAKELLTSVESGARQQLPNGRDLPGSGMAEIKKIFAGDKTLSVYAGDNMITVYLHSPAWKVETGRNRGLETPLRNLATGTTTGSYAAFSAPELGGYFVNTRIPASMLPALQNELGLAP